MSPEPMDWTQFLMARQLLAEERVGRPLREAQAAEDAHFMATKAALTDRG